MARSKGPKWCDQVFSSFYLCSASLCVLGKFPHHSLPQDGSSLFSINHLLMIVYQSTHAQRTSFQDLCWVLKVSGSMILHACMRSHFSCVRLFVTLWTVAHQAPWSMGFSRQECWSGLDISFSRDLSDPRTEPVSCVSCTGKQILYHCAIWKPQTGLEDPQSSPEANGTRIPGLPAKTEKIWSIFFNTSPECPGFFRPRTWAPSLCLLGHWTDEMVHWGNITSVEGTAKDKPGEHLPLRGQQRNK